MKGTKHAVHEGTFWSRDASGSYFRWDESQDDWLPVKMPPPEVLRLLDESSEDYQEARSSRVPPKTLVLSPLVVILGLAGWALADPYANIPFVSPIVCSLKGASWTEGSPLLDVPAGCYERPTRADSDTQQESRSGQEDGAQTLSPKDTQEAVVTLPDLTGWHLSQAQLELGEGYGLDASAVDVCDAFALRGEVVGMEPPAGTPVEDLSRVTLKINRSRAIPFVVGKRESVAIERLRSKGFEVSVRYVDQDLDIPGVVTDQRKGAAGKRACLGETETILVEIARGEEY